MCVCMYLFLKSVCFYLFLKSVCFCFSLFLSGEWFKDKEGEKQENDLFYASARPVSAAYKQVVYLQYFRTQN